MLSSKNNIFFSVEVVQRGKKYFIKQNHTDKYYIFYQEALGQGYHMIATAQLILLFLITPMSTSNTASRPGISRSLTMDRRQSI